MGDRGLKESAEGAAGGGGVGEGPHVVEGEEGGAVDGVFADFEPEFGWEGEEAEGLVMRVRGRELGVGVRIGVRTFGSWWLVGAFWSSLGMRRGGVGRDGMVDCWFLELVEVVCGIVEAETCPATGRSES